MSLLPLALLTALTFTASNGVIVHPTGVESFSVPYRDHSDLGAFWCAAGEYTLRNLKKPGDTRIFRTSLPPRRSGQGVEFSLDAKASAGKTGLVLLGPDDGSISAGLATALCELDR